jgi:hypothetical protein
MSSPEFASQNMGKKSYHPIISQVRHRQSFDGHKWDLPLKGCHGSTILGGRDEDVHRRSGLQNENIGEGGRDVIPRAGTEDSVYSIDQASKPKVGYAH